MICSASVGKVTACGLEHRSSILDTGRDFSLGHKCVLTVSDAHWNPHRVGTRDSSRKGKAVGA
jgi:hypothetical protein